MCRYVVALAFSGNGKRLVAVTGDNRHTVNVFHWKSKTLIHSDVGHNGQPPQVGTQAYRHCCRRGGGAVVSGSAWTHAVCGRPAMRCTSPHAKGVVWRRLRERAQVFGVVWNNWIKDRDGEGREFIAPSMFVTYGVKHLKFWTQEFNEVCALSDKGHGDT